VALFKEKRKDLITATLTLYGKKTERKQGNTGTVYRVALDGQFDNRNSPVIEMPVYAILF
jgi:hypothetical protein